MNALLNWVVYKTKKLFLSQSEVHQWFLLSGLNWEYLGHLEFKWHFIHLPFVKSELNYTLLVNVFAFRIVEMPAMRTTEVVLVVLATFVGSSDPRLSHKVHQILIIFRQVQFVVFNCFQVVRVHLLAWLLELAVISRNKHINDICFVDQKCQAIVPNLEAPNVAVRRVNHCWVVVREINLNEVFLNSNIIKLLIQFVR